MTVITFIGEFSSYLESLVMFSEPLCLTGDFNIHVDDINDSAARLFADLLDSMALNQHVHSATHELGHTLDLVIIRQSDHLIFGEPCAGVLFSDHRGILFCIHSSRRSFKSHAVSFRKIKSIDRDEFMNDISRSALCSSTTDDPDLFCLLFGKSLRSILNHHAPVLHKTVTTRLRVPWINDEILTAKRHRRKAERRWRASRSTTDLFLFRLCRNRVTFRLNKARCAYYTNFVSENCMNQRKRFSACNSLRNLSKCACLPLHSNPSQLGNDFGKFFRDKINSIRLEIARQCCCSGLGDSHLALYVPSFSEFRLLSETEVLIKSSTKTCSLDPIPTKLFTDCLDVLLTPNTKLINQLIFRWNQAVFLFSGSVLWLNHF